MERMRSWVLLGLMCRFARLLDDSFRRPKFGLGLGELAAKGLHFALAGKVLRAAVIDPAREHHPGVRGIVLLRVQQRSAAWAFVTHGFTVMDADV